jgi:hypothetical protein
MIGPDGTLEMVEPIGYFGTGQGTIEVLLGDSPSYYQLHASREDFDEQLRILVSAWRSQRRVRATIRGTTIVIVAPA